MNPQFKAQMDYNRAGSRQQAAGSRQQAAGSRQQAAGTLPVRRDLILTGRNLQALARLHYDIRPLLETDPRLRIHYTITPGSRFRHNTKRFATEIPHEILPWEEAQALHADLAISASANGDLYSLSPQLMLLPHGAGHSRKVGTLPGASGLSSQQLVGPQGELPAAIALPGPAAQNRLAIDCPAALNRASLIGDICLERLRLSQQCREEYRRHLGVSNHTLVLFSSTWGPHSAYFAHPDLPRQLHHSLPADDFKVAFVPHPNIEAERCGPLPQLHQPYVANGLFMPQTDEGWRALLIASDVVIGDHGSVTVYAAALDKPIGLATFGFTEITPHEPLAQLGQRAISLEPESDLPRQIDNIVNRHQSGQFQPLTQQILAENTDHGTEITPSHALRDMIYEQLSLDPPLVQWAPELLATPTPATGYAPTSAWTCDIDIDGIDVTWQRFPIAHSRHDTPTSPHAHTITDLVTRRPEWREATVLLRHHEILPPRDAEAELKHIFATYRLCAAASVRLSTNQVLVGTPERVSLRPGKPARPAHQLTATAELGPLTETVLNMVPSAIYWWQRTRDWNSFPPELVFRRGESRCHVSIARTDSSTAPAQRSEEPPAGH